MLCVEFASAFGLVLANIDIYDTISTAVKRGHVRTLKDDISPIRRQEQFSGLTFALIDDPSTMLVQGDAPLISQTIGQDTCTPFVDAGQVLAAALLPLSPTRALVGTLGTLQPATLCGLRENSIRCSLEYFIAHQWDLDTQALTSLIGQTARLVSIQQIDMILQDTLAEALQG